mgnify:CR=1 FL=1|nr:MAG TPA: hypothetical protein [Caudoviricetes sp.]
MTLFQIQQAVKAGKTVHWASTAYQVEVDNLGQWFIHCTLNDHYIGLTHRDGITLNGKEEEFFIGG